MQPDPQIGDLVEILRDAVVEGARRTRRIVEITRGGGVYGEGDAGRQYDVRLEGASGGFRLGHGPDLRGYCVGFVIVNWSTTHNGRKFWRISRPEVVR